MAAKTSRTTGPGPDFNALVAAQVAASKDYAARRMTFFASREAWVQAQRAGGIYEGKGSEPSAALPSNFVALAEAHRANVQALQKSKAAFDAAAKALSTAIAAATA